MMTNKKVPLYVTKVPSTSFIREASWERSEFYRAILFTYLKDDEERLAGVRFKMVSALRQRGERCCTVWHTNIAYDTLVEVHNSSWIAEIRQDVDRIYWAEWKPRHFMIYLDSAGCFEVLAEDFELLPESVDLWEKL